MGPVSDVLHTCCFALDDSKYQEELCFMQKQRESLFTDHFLGDLDENKREKVETGADYDS